MYDELYSSPTSHHPLIMHDLHTASIRHIYGLLYIYTLKYPENISAIWHTIPKLLIYTPSPHHNPPTQHYYIYFPTIPTTPSPHHSPPHHPTPPVTTHTHTAAGTIRSVTRGIAVQHDGSDLKWQTLLSSKQQFFTHSTRRLLFSVVTLLSQGQLKI